MRRGERGEKEKVNERDTLYVEVECGTCCSDNEGRGSVGTGCLERTGGWFE